jgi:hypothetical protein
MACIVTDASAASVFVAPRLPIRPSFAAVTWRCHCNNLFRKSSENIFLLALPVGGGGVA